MRSNETKRNDEEDFNIFCLWITWKDPRDIDLIILEFFFLRKAFTGEILYQRWITYKSKAAREKGSNNEKRKTFCEKKGNNVIEFAISKWFFFLNGKQFSAQEKNISGGGQAPKMKRFNLYKGNFELFKRRQWSLFKKLCVFASQFVFPPKIKRGEVIYAMIFHVDD